MKILVFLHGTILMHRNASGRTREQRVRQVQEGVDDSLQDFASYIPVENAVQKVQAWSEQGAEIVYLSSQANAQDVEKDEAVLRRWGFPPGDVYYRQGGESYSAIAERIAPDILVEDDCESIGGEQEMAYTYVSPEARRRIKPITVKEFGGIDHLPDEVEALRSCSL